MSRIGKRVLKIPENVEVKISSDFREIVVNGPLGTITKKLSGKVEVLIKNNEITTTMLKNTKKNEYALLGTTNSIIENFLIGVTKEYEKKLIISGLGYKALLKGNVLQLNLGFSHPVIFDIPEGIKIEVDKNTMLKISGIDKELVGLVASKIRKIKKVEPYKGKGITYVGEQVKRKVGKTGAST